MAKALVDMGAVVIGVDIRQYLGALGKAALRENAPCQLIAGDFETTKDVARVMSHYLAAWNK
jgi:hypothetical protein